MKLFQAIWQDIRARQNLDIYITVAIAIVVAILGIFGIADQAIISSAVLATLGLVSVSLLMNRRENEGIQNALLRIDNTDHLSEHFLKREYDRFRVQQLVQNSRKAFFWGFTFTQTLSLLRVGGIAQYLQDGLEIRFLFIKPSSGEVASDVVKMTAFRTTSSDTAKIDYTLQLNLSYLAELAKYAPSGKLEVRVVDYLPPWHMVAIDPHLPTGHMFVRLNSFRDSDAKRPTFELTARGDNKWFHFFVEQFEAVWNESEPVDLHQYARKQDQSKK